MREGNMQVRRIVFLFFVIVSVFSIFPAWGSDISLDDIERWEKEKAVEPLIAALRDWRVREAAADALEKIDPYWPKSDAAIKQVPEFIKTFADKDWNVQEVATGALGKIGGTRAVDSLIAALSDKDRYVRSAAADTLGEIGDNRSVKPLITALRDEILDVRKAAAWALGEIGDARAFESLFIAHKDKEEKVRSAAANALNMIEYANAIEPRIASLRNGSVSAIASLSMIINRLSPREKRSSVIKLVLNLPCNIWVSLLALLGSAMLLPLIKKGINRLLNLRVKMPGSIFIFCVGYGLTLLIIITILAIIYPMTYNVNPSFLTSSMIISTLTVVYIFPFLIILLVLSATPVFNSKWLEAKKNAMSFICGTCLHRRFVLGPGLPWIVRWSGRILAEEAPKIHDHFKNYFVCQTCKEKDARLAGVQEMTGLIGGNIEGLRQKGNKAYIGIWSESQKRTKNADIDILEIRNTPGISYDYAINDVLKTLKNDVSRPGNYLKNIPVVLKGNPPVSENSMRLLEQEFKEIRYEG